MGSRRRLATALLVVAATSAACLAAEAVFRRLRPGFVAGADPAGNPFWVHDPLLGWFHRPGETGTFSRPEFSHPVRINATGFRDVERSADPKTRPRIAFYGDSFAWGHGVGDGDVVTRLLEERLPGVEVWNLAVSAYSTDQEILLNRRFAPSVRPDLVVVMLSRNDFEGNVSDTYGAYPKPRFVEREGRLEAAPAAVPRPGPWLRAASWARRRSAIVNALAWTLEYGREAPERPSPGRAEEIRVTLRLLDLFAAEVGASGTRFAVALVPSDAHTYAASIPDLEMRRFAAIAEWGAANGVGVLDLTPAFREAFARTGVRTHFRQDKHWNEAGHRLAADTLAALLRDRGLVPSPER